MQWSPPNILSAVFWAIWAANFFLPFAGEWQAPLRILGLVLLCIHGLECVVFWKRLEATGRTRLNVFYTLLFGIFHVRTLPGGNKG